MYSLHDVRRNFLPALATAIGLTALLALLILKLEGWTVRHVFQESPYEIWGFLIGVPSFLTISVLAWRSAFSIAHRGWKRILLLCSAAGFLVPVILEMSSHRIDLQDVVEGVVGGVFVSTVIVAMSQIVFATYKWIKSGFDEAKDPDEPLDI